jgi:hypothetical protein
MFNEIRTRVKSSIATGLQTRWPRNRCSTRSGVTVFLHSVQMRSDVCPTSYNGYWDFLRRKYGRGLRLATHYLVPMLRIHGAIACFCCLVRLLGVVLSYSYGTTLRFIKASSLFCFLYIRVIVNLQTPPIPDYGFQYSASTLQAVLGLLSLSIEKLILIC